MRSLTSSKGPANGWVEKTKIKLGRQTSYSTGGCWYQKKGGWGYGGALKLRVSFEKRHVKKMPAQNKGWERKKGNTKKDKNPIGKTWKRKEKNLGGAPPAETTEKKVVTF